MGNSIRSSSWSQYESDSNSSWESGVERGKIGVIDIFIRSDQNQGDITTNFSAKFLSKTLHHWKS